MKIELGGGQYPVGGEWVNVDKIDHSSVKYHVDFDAAGMWLPFEDESIDAVYSSHCFEHVVELKNLLHEVVRVCKVGATVEIRVPAPFSAMAMCHDHVQVIADEQVLHWCESAIDYWFGGCKRRLKHRQTDRIPGSYFVEAKGLFPHLNDDQIMRIIPNCCHEHRYYLSVIENE